LRTSASRTTSTLDERGSIIFYWELINIQDNEIYTVTHGRDAGLFRLLFAWLI